MIKIILMFPWSLLGNLIAKELGLGSIMQIVCGFIGCAMACVLIEML